MMNQNQSFAAHEILDSMEALRTKAVEIEQHGLFATQCQDPQLKTLLKNHQQRMIQAYQQGVGILQGKGAAMNHQPPTLTNADYTIGVQNPAQMTTSPNPMPSQLSDYSITALALNTHKAGAMMGMMWASECSDPNLRSFHIQGANLCQEMAYELFQYMNARGYYQPPTFQDGTHLSTMVGMFQPVSTQMTTMMPPTSQGIQATQQMMHNSHYGMGTHSTNTHGTTGYYQ